MKVSLFYLPGIGSRSQIEEGMVGLRGEVYDQMLREVSEQAKLADREVPFGEDLGHRSPDDAGGAEDGDGERADFCGHSSTRICLVDERRPSISAARPNPRPAHTRRPMRTVDA